MLPKEKVLQTINEAKRKLDIEDIKFEVRYSNRTGKTGKKAEIFIQSRKYAQIILYPTATFFSVRHELCHAKLYRMGIPLTNTEGDHELFNDSGDYIKMVLVAEWYVNELQRRVFSEYYAVDEIGTPRPKPFPSLPDLPKERFTAQQITHIMKTTKRFEGKRSDDRNPSIFSKKQSHHNPKQQLKPHQY
ncbi:MAG: hypothetical protein ACLFU9_06245 [Candidatus Bathyarchaeia archaeon]